MNLYIVDDDEGVREALATLFIARQYRVQAFPSGEDFLSLAETQNTGCVLLDVRMGNGMNGLQVFDALQNKASPLLVILLSGHLEIPMATTYTRKGVFDCLEKNCAESMLIARVKDAMIQVALTEERLKSIQATRQRWKSLTPREMDVARLIRLGWSNKLIADQLKIGVRSVETHRAKVFAKMWAENPTELDRLMRENTIL